LKSAGKLDDAIGFIIGPFTNSKPKKPEKSLKMEEVLQYFIGSLNKPTVNEVDIGHCTPHFGIPFGTKAILDVDKKVLQIESGVYECKGGMGMFITDIKYYRYKTPLKKPFKTALRTVDVIESIYVFIETNQKEMVGVGEAVPTYVITGDTKGGIEAAIEEVFKPLLINRPLSIGLLDEMDEALVGNSSAKAAIDIALYDLLAQEAKSPLYEYLNNDPGNKSLETCCTVSLNEADEMVEDAFRYIQEGYNHLKIKVGKDSVETDLNRLKALRAALPKDTTLSVDANQAWNEKGAEQALKHFDE